MGNYLNYHILFSWISSAERCRITALEIKDIRQTLKLQQMVTDWSVKGISEGTWKISGKLASNALIKGFQLLPQLRGIVH